MRVKKFNSSGTLINSLFQISGNDGFPASIEEYNNNIYIHAGASGYNIFNAVFDLSGNQIANNSVTDGRSGSGDIVVINGDIYMAMSKHLGVDKAI